MRTIRQYGAVAAVAVMLMGAGCASERPAPVPSSAALMTDGQGMASFRASEHGRVYVTDQTDNNILYTSEVDKDDMVSVDATKDRIEVGGRTVFNKSLDDGHHYRVFFEPMDKEKVVKYRVTETKVESSK